MPVIGYLNNGSPESDTFRLTGLRRGLNETGYFEGRNLVIEYRWAANQADRPFWAPYPRKKWIERVLRKVDQDAIVYPCGRYDPARDCGEERCRIQATRCLNTRSPALDADYKSP
jgi:hypothetical protein